MRKNGGGEGVAEGGQRPGRPGRPGVAPVGVGEVIINKELVTQALTGAIRLGTGTVIL